MKKKHFSLNIETLVLVAIWDHPFIFQGSFTITNTINNSNQLLLFRCTCGLKDKMDILDIEFSPYDYMFTYLYDGAVEVLANANDDLEHALYLLKYSLKETLQKMIINPNQRLTHFDEIAMSSIAQQIKKHMIYHGQKRMDDNNIGFSVSISFTPTEKIGKKAALTLLKINKENTTQNKLH
jgi:hypothetical protein